MNPVAAQAHAYLDAGLSVLPLKGKLPYGRWKKLQTTPMDHAKADLWWSQFDPPPGLGIITGPVSSSLAVLDIEPEHVERAKHILPLGAPHARTARGGLHFYCQGQTRNGKLRVDGAVVGDVRGRGGYVVAPPTAIGSGNYIWEGPARWTPADLPQIPDWACRQPRGVDRKFHGRGEAGSGVGTLERARPSRGIRSTQDLLAYVPAKLLAAIERGNRSSEIDFALVRELVWAGASYAEVEELMESHAVGENVRFHHDTKGSGGYLYRTYDAAVDSVEETREWGVELRCVDVMVGDGGFVGGALRRISLWFEDTEDGKRYAMTIPMVLGTPRMGEMSGEWQSVCAAYGVPASEIVPVMRGTVFGEVRSGRVWRVW